MPTTIRIPLTGKNSTVTPYYNPDAPPVVPDAPPFTLPEARLTLSPAIIGEYNYSRYAFPATEISVNIPDDDLEAVRAWFGQTATGVTAPGTTLVKRMTEAVIPEIRQFYTEAARASLFTRSFRLGYAIRLDDGTHVAAAAPRLVTPNARAPLMAVREPVLSGNTLRTLTEIMNMPMELTFSIPAFEIPADYASRVSALDIYATRQCDTLAGDETVKAIRTYSIYGENVPCWHYSRLAEDLVREAAEADNAFRIIGSLPAKEAAAGINALRLPSNFKNLDNWDNYPAIDVGGGSGVTSPESSHIRILTAPLDHGMPDTFKRIRGVTARGIFPRGAEGIRVTLLRSHHRDVWIPVATATGAHIRLLRAVRSRWYQVEITAPRGSVVDAIVFEVVKA